MREHDPNLVIRLEHDIAEVGGIFRCDVTRSPTDGERNDKAIGQVRAVRIRLHRTTEGRGTVAAADAATVELPVDEFGMASGQIELPVPPDAPISYDGMLIRVRWEIEARTDLRLQVDQTSSAEVLVVPRGGLGRYDRAHPLPHG